MPNFWKNIKYTKSKQIEIYSITFRNSKIHIYYQKNVTLRYVQKRFNSKHKKIRYSIFDIWYLIFDIRYSIFDIRYLIFDIRYSIFDIRYSFCDQSTVPCPTVPYGIRYYSQCYRQRLVVFNSIFYISTLYTYVRIYKGPYVYYYELEIMLNPGKSGTSLLHNVLLHISATTGCTGTIDSIYDELIE